MRESGKSKKIKGWKEVITYGNHPYKLPITDARGKTTQVEFVATLVELVPDYKPCNICKKYISKVEEDMAPHIVSCEHKNFTTEKINDRVMKYNCPDCEATWPPKPDMPYWEPIGMQEFICFECYGDMIEMESGLEVSWYGIRL